MKSFTRIATLLIPIATVFAGCAPSDEQSTLGDGIDVPLETAAPGSAYEPPTGRNGLLPQQFWSELAQRAMRELKSYPLNGGGFIVETSGAVVPKMPSLTDTNALLGAYPDVVKHLIQCALADNEAIYNPTGTIRFQGWWGLGSSWVNSPNGIASQTDAQEWITGCMLARLNKLGVHVDILLEGATPRIETVEPYNTEYRYNEATYYGNMFDSPDPVVPNKPAFKAYVCRELDLVGTCSDGGEDWIDRRLCDNAPFTCGLVDVGKCYSSSGKCIANGSQHWACETSSTTHQFRTVGVQLLDPLDPKYCDN